MNETTQLQARASTIAQADHTLKNVTTQGPKDLNPAGRRWFMWWYELTYARCVKAAKAGTA